MVSATEIYGWRQANKNNYGGCDELTVILK